MNFMTLHIHILEIFLYLCMYLASLGLSCSTKDLQSSLMHVGPLMVACILFVCNAGSSSLTRVQTWTPCIGSLES